MSDLRYLTLPNGNQIPSVGLGTYAPRNTDKEISEAIRNAVKVGYRHFDCAALYMNEKVIGEALNKAMNDGLVKREELFITSKLWDTFHRPDLVRTALKTTLQDLKLEYLDLYLIHWPVSFLEDAGLFPKDDNGVMICSDVDYVDTWKSLEECVKEGLVRNIGISNFNSKQVQRVLDMCSIKPCTNQVEVNVHFANSKLIEFCHRNGITVTSYCPLGSPDNKQDQAPVISSLEEPYIKDLAKKKNKTPAQIILRFILQRGLAVVPKSVTASRIQENFQVFDFELTAEEMSGILSLNKDHRLLKEEIAIHHKYYPFHEEF